MYYIYIFIYYIHICADGPFTVQRNATFLCFPWPVMSCYPSCDLAHEVDGVGWGGVGHVNVRWNLHMTLMLRDEPFVGPCTWRWCYAMNLRWTLHMTLMLRDEPSLELAHDVDATWWTFVGPCTWLWCYAMNGGLGWGMLTHGQSAAELVTTQTTEQQKMPSWMAWNQTMLFWWRNSGFA